MKLLPRSLAARTTLVLLAGLIASDLIGLLIYAGDRTTALKLVAGATNAERIAAVVRTLETLPGEERAAALCSQSGAGLRVALSRRPVVTHDSTSARAARLRAVLRDALGISATRDIHIASLDSIGPAARDIFARVLADCGNNFSGAMGRMMGEGSGMSSMQFSPQMARMMQHWSGGDSLVLAYPLQDGSWLDILAPALRFEPIWKSRFLLAFLVTTLIVSALSVWAVRRSTEPLALFAWAATRLGHDVNAPDLPEDGPREVSKAARAFNEMQRRLRRLINDRTQMLAAISHDLRTPITRLRLRAEFVEDDEQREKMMTDLEQMEAMISATLAFARLDSSDEAPKPFDLAGLVQSVCDDAAELGRDVSYEGEERLTFTGRPVALRRVFENLVDNAVKYGGNARVTLELSPPGVTITVDDTGPGIPEDALFRVFTPFDRVETSRNRETGGVGLGLAIVRSIIEGHGGAVSLANRPEGGLRAVVVLPRT